MKLAILSVIFTALIACIAHAEEDTMSSIVGALAQSLAGGQGAQGQEESTPSDQQLRYYTDPKSEGYYKRVWGGVCRRCEEPFAMSAAEINGKNCVNCPNCHASNDPAQALRDYQYIQQRNTSQRSFSNSPTGLNGNNNNSSFGSFGNTADGSANSYSYGGGPGYTSSNRPGGGYRWKIGGSDS